MWRCSTRKPSHKRHKIRGFRRAWSRRLPARMVLKRSALVDTRVIYGGDNLEKLAKLPDACVDLIYIYPPFNRNFTNDSRKGI